MERLELSRHYWHQILSLECLHSTTPPINPRFIHLKETKKTLAKNLQDPQSLRIRYPLQQPGWWAVGGEGLEPPNPNGSGLWNVVDSNYHKKPNLSINIPVICYSLLCYYSPLQLPLCDPPKKLLTHHLYLGSESDSNRRKHAPQACAYTSRPSLPYFERHGRIGLPSPA